MRKKSYSDLGLASSDASEGGRNSTGCLRYIGQGGRTTRQVSAAPARRAISDAVKVPATMPTGMAMTTEDHSMIVMIFEASF